MNTSGVKGRLTGIAAKMGKKLPEGLLRVLLVPLAMAVWLAEPPQVYPAVAIGLTVWVLAPLPILAELDPKSVGAYAIIAIMVAPVIVLMAVAAKMGKRTPSSKRPRA